MRRRPGYETSTRQHLKEDSAQLHSSHVPHLVDFERGRSMTRDEAKRRPYDGPRPRMLSVPTVAIRPGFITLTDSEEFVIPSTPTNVESLRERRRHTALRPKMVADSERPYCVHCYQVFGFVRRRHHCRNCGEVFCHDCSSHFIPLKHLGYETHQRVCTKCLHTLQDLDKTSNRSQNELCVVIDADREVGDNTLGNILMDPHSAQRILDANGESKKPTKKRRKGKARRKLRKQRSNSLEIPGQHQRRPRRLEIPTTNDDDCSGDSLPHSPLVDVLVPFSQSKKEKFISHLLSHKSRDLTQRDYEDVSAYVNYANPQPVSLDLLLKKYFGKVVDDSLHEFRSRRINRALSLLNYANPDLDIKRRVRAIDPELSITEYSESEGTDPEISLKTTPKQVHFLDIPQDEPLEPLTPTRALAREKTDSILKNKIVHQETWHSAFSRVLHERQLQIKNHVDVLKQGSYLNLVNGPNTKRVFVIISQDEEEIAWGENVQSVTNSIQHKKSIMDFFKSSVSHKCLADVMSITYGTGTDPAFNRYLSRGGKAWLCFCLKFDDSSVHFATNTEPQVKDWFLGLQSLIPLSSKYTTLGTFYWMRARMKILHLARSLHQYPRVVVEKVYKDALSARQRELAASENDADHSTTSTSSVDIHIQSSASEHKTRKLSIPGLRQVGENDIVLDLPVILGEQDEDD